MLRSSISPESLDRQDLVSLWRESLLARKAIEKKNKDYENQPQLRRHKDSFNPLTNINYYLSSVHEEAQKRGYDVDAKKIALLKNKMKDTKVSNGQVNYEFKHILKKLEDRDYGEFSKIKEAGMGSIKTNKTFKVVQGNVESWEKAKN